MKRLSRNDIECIAQRVLAAYFQLPEIKYTTIYRIEPEILLEQVLGLKIDYQHLSVDGSILGMTSFQELGVELVDDTDGELFYILDGKTVLVEKDLKQNASQRGRFHFTLMHEGSHQIFKMFYPNDYGVRAEEAVHFHMANSEPNQPIKDWEEWQSNTLASAILLPKMLIVQGMTLFNLGRRLPYLSRDAEDIVYQRFCALANFLGVSKSALAIRMKHLGLLEKEYLEPDPNVWTKLAGGCLIEWFKKV